jgi:cephalosporin hydroxylase
MPRRHFAVAKGPLIAEYWCAMSDKHMVRNPLRMRNRLRRALKQRRQTITRLLGGLLPLYRRTVGRVVNKLFMLDLVSQTENFRHVRWLGQPLWQNTTDLWTIQEVISEVRPGLLIETGTYEGGSARFYASLMDLMDHGRVITIDLRRKPEIDHPRVTFIPGSSTDPFVVARVRAEVAKTEGSVMVILDSDHRQAHVAAELEAYASLVTPGSYILVQDGIMDELLPALRKDTPGPVPAIRAFLKAHPEFVEDSELSERFLITSHPHGWLRRLVGPSPQGGENPEPRP